MERNECARRARFFRGGRRRGDAIIRSAQSWRLAGIVLKIRARAPYTSRSSNYTIALPLIPSTHRPSLRTRSLRPFGRGARAKHLSSPGSRDACIRKPARSRMAAAAAVALPLEGHDLQLNVALVSGVTNAKCVHRGSCLGAPPAATACPAERSPHRSPRQHIHTHPRAPKSTQVRPRLARPRRPRAGVRPPRRPPRRALAPPAAAGRAPRRHARRAGGAQGAHGARRARARPERVQAR